MRGALVTLLLVGTIEFACAAPERGIRDETRPAPMRTAAPAEHASPPPSPPPKAAPRAPLVFLEDDMAGARARASAAGKLLFVDAWAPWCHTCLSMRNFVLSDPSLAPLAELAV